MSDKLKKRIMALIVGTVGVGMMLFIGLMLWVGIAAIWGTVSRSWVDYFRTASWAEAPAVVHWAELKSEHGGEDTTYRVVCRYSYLVDGQVYEGKRVSVDRRSSTEDFHFQRHQFLQEQIALGLTADDLRREEAKPKLFRALVNKANPKEAVLFREITRFMWITPLMGVVFIAFSAGLGGWLLWERIIAEKQSRARALYKNQPWRVPQKWHGHEVAADGRIELPAMWYLFILSTSFILSFWIAVWGVWWPVGLVIYSALGLVSLFPLCSGYWAVKLSVQRLRFGRVRLVLAEMPIVPGRMCTALLVIARPVTFTEPLRVTVQCKERIVPKSDDSTKWRVVHTDEFLISECIEPCGKGVSIPVVFTIAADQMSCEEQEFSKHTLDHVWKMTVKGKTGGLRLEAEFDLPVYRVADEGLIEVNPEMRAAG